MIVPITLLFMLQVLVFLLPAESGERVGYTVTILLAISMFLTLIAGELPRVSEPFPAVCFYLMVVLGLSSAMTVVVIFNLSLYYKQGAVPECLASFTRVVLCRRCTKQGERKYEKQTSAFTIGPEAVNIPSFLNTLIPFYIIHLLCIFVSVSIQCAVRFMDDNAILWGRGRVKCPKSSPKMSFCHVQKLAIISK